VAAELRDSDLERDAGACRRLLEDHPESAAGEEMVLFAALLPVFQIVGEVEGAQQLVAAPVGDPSEVPPFQAFGHDCHRAGC